MKLVRDNEYRLLQLLREGELDLAFAVTPYAQESEKLHRLLLKKYPLMVIMHSHHLLSERPYLTYQDLKEEAFLFLEPEIRPRTETEESE